MAPICAIQFASAEDVRPNLTTCPSCSPIGKIRSNNTPDHFSRTAGFYQKQGSATAAFQRRDFTAAIAAIEPVFSERERICGSRAQIDLVEFTLLKSYLAAGRLEDVRRMLQARRPGPRGIPVPGLKAAAIG